MTAYRTLHVVRHVMPDDRLVHVWTAAGEDDDALIFEYRDQHIAPDLVQDMAALSSGIAECGILDFDLHRLGEPGGVDAWLLRIPDDDMPDGKLMVPHVYHHVGMPLAFEIRCRASMIDPAMVREMNEHVLPSVCGCLVPLGQVIH